MLTHIELRWFKMVSQSNQQEKTLKLFSLSKLGDQQTNLGRFKMLFFQQGSKARFHKMTENQDEYHFSLLLSSVCYCCWLCSRSSC